MLWRALKSVQHGSYIDIGAADPIAYSVSYGFYLKGWRGVHVDPLPQKASALRSNRPDEVVIQAAVSSSVGKVPFYEINGGNGLDTFDKEGALAFQKKGMSVKQIDVATIPLRDILEQHAGPDIHWLKIDVEGHEKEVIESWNGSEIRPWIVVVESTIPASQESNHFSWDQLIIEKGYKYVYFDGLNRFYLSENHLDLEGCFGYPPCIFDEFQLCPGHHFSSPRIKDNLGRGSYPTSFLLRLMLKCMRMALSRMLEILARIHKILFMKCKPEKHNGLIVAAEGALESNDVATNQLLSAAEIHKKGRQL